MGSDRRGDEKGRRKRRRRRRRRAKTEKEKARGGGSGVAETVCVNHTIGIHKNIRN
jgi:hypothetical protein